MMDFPDADEPPPCCNSVQGEYRQAAVVSNTEYCSSVGRQLLERGGSAADALIGTLLCEGLCGMQNLGLGGGSFMTFYSRAEGRAVCLDAREAAPARASRHMFAGDYRTAATGALSIGVPGELMGYWEAHRRFGRLPWRELFRPAISLCLEGVPVNRRLGKAFSDAGIGPEISASPSLRRVLGLEGRTAPVMGDRLRLACLARTLEAVAGSGRGAQELYSGQLAAPFLNDLAALGSIITADDLINYRALWVEPVSAELSGGLRVYSAPPPASGPVLLLTLRLLDGQLGADRPANALAIAEAFKYAYALRTHLADPRHSDLSPSLGRLNSAAYVEEVRQKISTLSRTSPSPAYYGARYEQARDHGTGNIVVAAPNGDMAVATSTINTMFGSLLASESTGIILNNQMDDFSCPAIINSYGLPPYPANYVGGGKRPLSSACPTVVVAGDGSARLGIGAAGGSLITSATAQVIINNLWFNWSIKKSVDSPRIHHQLIPMQLRYEDGIRADVLQKVKEAGHTLKSMRPSSSVTAVAVEGGLITAAYDYRRGGSTAGY